MKTSCCCSKQTSGNASQFLKQGKTSFESDTLFEKMPGKRTYDNIIQLVYFNYYKGKSAKDLAEMFSLKLSTVYNIINRAKNEDRLELKQSPGRPKKLNRREENKIIKTIYNNPYASTRSIARDLKNDCRVDVSHETVRKVLKDNKYSSRIARKNRCFLPKTLKNVYPLRESTFLTLLNTGII